MANERVQKDRSPYCLAQFDWADQRGFKSGMCASAASAYSPRAWEVSYEPGTYFVVETWNGVPMFYTGTVVTVWGVALTKATPPPAMTPTPWKDMPWLGVAWR